MTTHAQVPARRHRRAQHATQVAIAVTLGATAVACAEDVDAIVRHAGSRALAATTALVLLLAGAVALMLAQLVHALARLGYVRRLGSPASAPATRTPAPHVTIVVPAYREQAKVVRRALMSATLQDYLARDVVLLLDDAGSDALTDDVRGLPAELRAMFARALRIIDERRCEFERRWPRRTTHRLETERLAAAFDGLAEWFIALADRELSGDHTARWFAERVLLVPAMQLREAARGLWLGPPLSDAEIRARYNALTRWLTPSISMFQRKRYANVPHDASKAANLNTFLSLRGFALREEHRDGALHLVHAEDGLPGELAFRSCDFVMNLDADSFVERDYLWRMVGVMTRPGNDRIAISQTPYRSIPGAPNKVQRLAGATTDVQHTVHCGMAHYGAASWVGANALLRVAALEDIASPPESRWPFRRFIADRTVVEDSETTVALVRRGWTVHSEVEAVAYSETPPDFGSLVVQRRRWANGGLLIVPALLRYAARRPRRIIEWTMRISYLTSPAISSFAASTLVVVFVAAYPFAADVRSPWLMLGAAPLFMLYAGDLRRYGYRRVEVCTVYALNLALVPVNIAGTLCSLYQAVTRRRKAFGRTPKVSHRTPIPATYVFAEWLVLAVLVTGTALHALAGRWVYAAFLATNALALTWALVNLVGVRAATNDVAQAVSRLQFRRLEHPPHWATDVFPADAT